MTREQTFFLACHAVILVFLAIAVISATRTVSRLRNASATFNVSLLSFAYFSLSSWLFWALQYAILLAAPFISLPSKLFQGIGLWLGVVQNALWITAILSLYSKQFSRVSVPLFVMFSLLIALLTYQTTVLTSQAFGYLEAVSATIIFVSFAYSIWQLRLSLLFAAAFLIHGYFQWIWRSLWLKPLTDTEIVLLAFPVWRIALLAAWIILISEMLVTLRVMISSTVKDLGQERHAAERAIHGLRLSSFRAETFGSVPDTPKTLCALWASQCHIFILMVGERYGYIIKSKGISVVEYEYDIAHAEDPGKILVYVKDGVTREQRLEEFLRRLQDFECGHVTSSFTTSDELFEKIQRDVKNWLTSYGEGEIIKRKGRSPSTSGLI